MIVFFYSHFFNYYEVWYEGLNQRLHMGNRKTLAEIDDLIASWIPRQG